MMSKSKHQQIEYNTGRLEFRSCSEQVLARVRQGQLRTTIYKELITEGKITMSYNAFCYHIRNSIGESKAKEPVKAVSQAKPFNSAAATRVKTETNKQNEFIRPRDLLDKPLI